MLWYYSSSTYYNITLLLEYVLEYVHLFVAALLNMDAGMAGFLFCLKRLDVCMYARLHNCTLPDLLE